MKCPYCGSAFNGKPQHCPNCKQPLSRAKQKTDESAPEQQRAKLPPRSRGQRVMTTLALIICALLLCYGIYKIVFWVSNYQITRLYTRGEYTPTINVITMDDGRQGHSVVFYGEDGDQVFLPELQRSLIISGGTARISIADSDWFSGDVTDIEAANVRLSPILIDEKGMRTQLPVMAFTIDVPDSPLQVLSPAQDGLDIVTARYELELQVVPGSTVLVNGQDVTDTVDRSGKLSQNINVYPIGNNVYTVIVRTPKHHETRQEITIHRKDYDIDVELDTSVSHNSSNENMTVTGIVEPGASVTVETAHVENSLITDPSTGEFSFIAKFSTFGENIVRFRVSMEGREDAVISMSVNYKPTLAKYSSLAWRMDYKQLVTLYEQWNSQVFKCVGPIVDVLHENDITYFVMDVGTEGEQQLVLLENQSTTNSPSIGVSYTAYAHVTGRHMYNAKYYPMLCALYVDLTPNT